MSDPAAPPAKRLRRVGDETSSSSLSSSFAVQRADSLATRTLAAMYDETALMDCRLIIHEKEEQVVLRAHRSVLAASSRPFHSMLLGELREASAVHNELTLHEVSAARFADLLKFIYGHPVDIEPETALPLFRVADMYEVLDLADLCCEYMRRQADDVSQCCLMLAAADAVHCAPVVQHCIRVITRHFEAASHHESFLHVPRSLLVSLLADKELFVKSESEVLDAVLAWLDFDEKRLPALSELATLIHWPQLPASRLAWLEIERPALFAPGTPLTEYCREAYRYQALKRAPQRDEALLARLSCPRTRRRPRQRFDASQLAFVTAVGKKGQGQSEFNCPEGIALSSQGYIYVADSLNHRIQVFDSNGAFLRAFGQHGSSNGDFNMPGGVAVGFDEHGNEIVVVTDQGNGRLQLFNAEGEFLRVISSAGSEDGQLLEPTGVVISPKGDEVIVADYQNCRVQVFDLTGRFLRKFGSPGEGEGQFKHPSGIALSPDGHLVVADYQNDRLQCFDVATGRFLRTIGRPGDRLGEFERPFDVAIASDGHILATDYENHRVQVLSPDGEYVSHFGTQGSGMTQFDSPGGVAVSADGDVVVVTDCGNGRFHLYRDHSEMHPPAPPQTASGPPRSKGGA